MNLKAICTTLLFILMFIINPFQIIQEGNVGVVYYFGSLQEKTLKPGLHLKIPFITTVYQVQVTIQTDYIKNVPCGTNSGVNIAFEKIEVVNQLMAPNVYEIIKNYTIDYDKPLIFDKITHEMAQICSKASLQEMYIDKFDKLDEFLTQHLQDYLDVYASGVKIVSVRLSKPIVPPEVQINYKRIVELQTEHLKAKTQQLNEMQTIQIENEKALSRVNADRELAMARVKTEQEKKMQEIEADKYHQLNQTEATKQKEIARITAEQLRLLADLEKEISINKKTIEKVIEHTTGLIQAQKLENEHHHLKKIAIIDIEHYRNMKYAEYMNNLVSPGYVAIEIARSLANNTKIYYGDKLPSNSFALLGATKFNLSEL